jgi:uncharacterized membrane protein YkvA (DUF1232 family)
VIVRRLRDWAAALKRDVASLWYAYRDPRTPFVAKALAVFIVAYAVSPIDLIPDFIPVIGYLDDLILLPAAIYLALRLIPEEVLKESRARATDRLTIRPSKSLRYLAATATVLVWLLLACLLWHGGAKLFT